LNVLTYDELRMIEREERAGGRLCKIEPDFIERFLAYVDEKQRVLDKNDDNVIAAKVKERTRSELMNAKTSYKNIFEARAHKVFTQAFIDIRMGANPDLIGLLDFEKDFYNKTKTLINDHLSITFKGKVKKEDEIIGFNDNNNVLVRFIKDFPEFAWNDLTLGPFKTEDVANLPKDVIKLLLSKEVVKEVLNGRN
jgi:DNA replication initiation complex subunit (GINS family)